MEMPWYAERTSSTSRRFSFQRKSRNDCPSGIRICSLMVTILPTDCGHVRILISSKKVSHTDCGLHVGATATHNRMSEFSNSAECCLSINASHGAFTPSAFSWREGTRNENARHQQALCPQRGAERKSVKGLERADRLAAPSDVSRFAPCENSIPASRRLQRCSSAF